MKSVYFYDEKTKEYSYEGYAQLDPLESEIQGREIYLLPANATFEKPFEKKDGWTQFWEDDKWIEIERLVKAKSERADYVSKIIVEVDDLMFDGDEVSQDRMARSIIALNLGEKVQWVLADNTIKMVTRAQLREALRKAGTAQTAIWSDPYTK